MYKITSMYVFHCGTHFFLGRTVMIPWITIYTSYNNHIDSSLHTDRDSSLWKCLVTHCKFMDVSELTGSVRSVMENSCCQTRSDIRDRTSQKYLFFMLWLTSISHQSEECNWQRTWLKSKLCLKYFENSSPVCNTRSCSCAHLLCSIIPKKICNNIFNILYTSLSRNSPSL